LSIDIIEFFANPKNPEDREARTTATSVAFVLQPEAEI
jgi:hypothetical protein